MFTCYDRGTPPSMYSGMSLYMRDISVANQNVSVQHLDTFDPVASGACCSRSCGDPGSRLEARAHSNDGDHRWADWKRWRCWGWCWWIWATCHRSCGGGGGGDDGDGGGWRGTLRWPATAVPPVAPCGHSEVGAAPVEGAVWHLSDGHWIGGDPRSWGGYQRVRRYAGGGKVFKVKPPAFLPITEKQNKCAIDVKSDFFKLYEQK